MDFISLAAMAAFGALIWGLIQACDWLMVLGSRS
jgi:hypothetical protein